LNEHLPKTYPRIVLECALAIAIGFGLAFLAHWLFGEEYAVRQQARIYAPIAGENYGGGKRDDIRVLLIDDAALAAAGQVWPAQYSYSARLLNAVAQYNPKAIFVDVYYGARRDDPTLPVLTRSVCALKQQGIALFMASARDGAGQYALRPELEALAGKCFDKVAIQYTPDDLDRIAWNYPLETHRAGEAPLKSAALALYESEGRHLKVDEHPLAVTWGSQPARHGIGWVRDAHGADTSYCRPSHGFWELIPPGPRNLFYHDVDKPMCVFHETVRAGELANTTADSDARLRREIEGKIILIGVAHTDSSDLLLSPLHGRIPGIYLHAMALDNLLVYGESYARHVHLGFGREQLPMMLFLLASMVAVTLLPKLVPRLLANNRRWKALRYHSLRLIARLRPPRGFWRRVVSLVVFLIMKIVRIFGALAAGCAMVWLGQSWFGLGFMSVIGVIFLTLLAEWFEFNEKLIEHLLPALPHSPHASTTEENIYVPPKAA
jgi:CHASE2 domain-containing sensor protein